MSDLFKSALNYIGSSTIQSSQNPNANTTSSEIIKLGGENVKIIKPIAEGGSSYVYGGQFAKSGLIIAVKKIPCQHDNEDKILSEIKYMNGFNHVNIAKYHGYNKLSGVYWIGMEYCTSLRLPLCGESVGPVFGQIVSGVNYLHQLGITHWDLKVENCMLGRDNMIKLIDFGSASTKVYSTINLTASQRNQLEDEFFQFTTPMYRPPEILDLWSEMVIDSRVDLWALGCLLYYFVHTEHPFSDSNKLAIINCKYPKKPSIFQHIIDGLLVINPDGRWSLGGVINELNSMGIDSAQPIKHLQFEELQLTIPSLIANTTQSTSILHSIRGGAESLFKNIKESSSRIYASQQQEQGQQQPPPSQSQQYPQKEQPQRPPPPKPQQKQHQSEPVRCPLTGEDQITTTTTKEAAPPPSSSSPSSASSNKNTAYDLLGGFDEKKNIMDGNQTQKKLIPEPSIDLLGGDDSINLIGGGSGVGGSSSSGTKSSDLLEDLFNLGTVPIPTPTLNKPNVLDPKKDPFESLLGNDISSVPFEKPPILPTSSSFSQLSSLKIDPSKSQNEMNKSTPNLNDLIFGDLLISDATTTTTTTMGKTRGGGQPTPFRFGSSTSTNTSVPFQNNNNKNISGSSNNSGIGGMSFGGVRNPTPSTFTSGPNFSSNSQTIGGNVPFGGVSSSTNVVGSASSTINNLSGSINNTSSSTTMGSKSSFPNYSATTNTMTSSTFSSDSMQNKPSAFGGNNNTTATNKKIDLNAAFGEFLNEQGFTGGSSQQTTNKTINEMRRVELAQTKTPEQMKVNDWVEGKRKNIRALLSTLHTVVWESCSWKPASMSIMVEPHDVKKVYRKACLAIHPDKQRGEEWEELAKIIFVELNDAWNHFEETS